MGMIGEFKEFAMRGNVVDMAVGIIIGGAFGTIVKSLVDDVMMPPLGALLGNVDFSELALTVQQARTPAEGEEIPAVTINYGNFINSVISFLIVAFALFLLVKGMNSMKRKADEKPAAPPEPSNEEKLLAEIRDVLKAKA